MKFSAFWASRLNTPHGLTRSSHIFQTDPSHIGQKPTYPVQSSLRRDVRWRYARDTSFLKQPSMRMTASMLSVNPTRPITPTNSQNLVCEASFNMLQSSSWWTESSCSRMSKAATKWSFQEWSITHPSPKRMMQLVIRPSFRPSQILREHFWRPMLDEDVKCLFLHAILVRLGSPIIFTCHQLSRHPYAFPQAPHRHYAHANSKQVSVPHPGALHALIMASGTHFRRKMRRPLATFIFEDILCQWGGAEIVTDNGPEFVATAGYLSEKYGIHHVKISPYSFQANGRSNEST